jgi:EAL domain-containing protein (putative c-di-GMP-specific phosphodiesterase class I)
MVPPGEFIAVAEEAGLIGAIGNLVLRETCRLNAIWQAGGLTDLQLSVNVSGHQFRSRELVHDVRKTLEETGMIPDRLTLELTESVVIEDAKENIDVLYALKEIGVKLSVDDFGTGYSSLSYLDQFPLDELKVDRAFVNQINATGEEAPIVSAIIAMARSLRFMVVAEGVEYEHQLEYLRANGCSQYQGFLFSKPLPAEEFVKIASRWKPGRP